MTTSQKKLGQAVRRLRQERDFSQESFADHVKVHRVYMGVVERGEVNLTLANIEKVAHGLGMKMWELLREADI